MLHYASRQVAYIYELYSQFGLVDAFRLRLSEVSRRPLVRLPINGFSVWIRPRTRDLIVANTTLDVEFEFIRDFLGVDFDGVIVDAGGYIGTAAIKLASMYPRATILTIEPSSSNFQLLQRNVEGIPNIETMQAALTARSGEKLALHDRYTGHWGFTTIVPVDKSNFAFLEEVDTVSLFDIKSRFRGRDIGLIKLDIEGGEKQLFEDCAIEFAEVPLVLVELHDRILPGCTSAFRAFSENRDIVDADGEKFLSISPYGRRLFDVTESADNRR